jgi:hypothetical protein
MLERMKAGETWSGVHFHGYTIVGADTDSTKFVFYRHRDGVALGFSTTSGKRLRGLLATRPKSPQLRPFWEELELVYGEL